MDNKNGVLELNVFNDVRKNLICVFYTVTRNILTVTDENCKRRIFLILPVNVSQSDCCISQNNS